MSDLQPRPNAVHADATVIDLHIHPSMSQQIFRRDVSLRQATRYSWDHETVRASFPRMKDGGYDAFLSVLHIPESGLLSDFPLLRIMALLHPLEWRKLISAEPWDALMAVMDDIERLAAASTERGPVQVARTRADLSALLAIPRDQRPMALIHAVEGAHVLGERGTTLATVLERVSALHKRGVAYLTLAHFYDNVAVSPCFPFPDHFTQLAKTLKLQKESNIWRDLTRGLTSVGESVVEHMLDLGMMIDLSHCTPAARRGVYRIVEQRRMAQAPILLTHVGAQGINPSPYNPNDGEIKWIADHGGVIGAIFMNYWLTPAPGKYSVNAIAQTLAHLVRAGGDDVAAIGTDFDGFTDPPYDLPDAARMLRLTERLLADGFSATQTQKMLGGNARRVLETQWGA